jgi:uncharacterized protein (UPF0212 family)
MYTNVRVGAMKCKNCEEQLMYFQYASHNMMNEYEMQYYYIPNKDLLCPSCGSFVIDGIKIEKI